MLNAKNIKDFRTSVLSIDKQNPAALQSKSQNFFASVFQDLSDCELRKCGVLIIFSRYNIFISFVSLPPVSPSRGHTGPYCETYQDMSAAIHYEYGDDEYQHSHNKKKERDVYFLF